MNLPLEAAILNVCLLCILTVPHEFAHAWVATRLGDPTPEDEHRVTLYPPSHIDLIGTVILPAITTLLGAGLVGWGRPVNTNPSKLRFGLNGLAMVALAGPASNIIMAVGFAGLSVFTMPLMADLGDFSARAAQLSVYLAIFNLLPVPPLDGSKLLIAARVPVVIYQEVARFGFILLLLAMAFTGLGGYLATWTYHVTQTIFSVFR